MIIFVFIYLLIINQLINQLFLGFVELLCSYYSINLSTNLPKRTFYNLSFVFQDFIHLQQKKYDRVGTAEQYGPTKSSPVLTGYLCNANIVHLGGDKKW